MWSFLHALVLSSVLINANGEGVYHEIDASDFDLSAMNLEEIYEDMTEFETEPKKSVFETNEIVKDHDEEAFDVEALLAEKKEHISPFITNRSNRPRLVCI